MIETYALEDNLDLIDAIVCKYTKSREPVRDRIEWSIACEIFLIQAPKYDASKSHNPGHSSFCMWIAWVVKRRLIDWKRKVHGRRRQYIRKSLQLDENRENYKADVEEKLAINDIVLRLPPKEHEAVLHFVSMHGNCVPEHRNGGNFHYWKKAIRSMKGMIECPLD